MEYTENGKEIMGSWHVDGFNLNSIITPLFEKGWQDCTRWKTVKRCSSHEEAKAECLRHNQEHFPNQTI
jgi:hypothetical protein